MKSKMLLLWLFILSLNLSCKKPYNPPAVNAPNSYLVVEGVINGNSDSTIIKLSRTVNLSQNTKSSAETKAKLNVEDMSGNSYPLNEASSGKYTCAPLNLDSTKKYRLHIQTNNGKTYFSDYVQFTSTPAIDSVGYHVTSNGLQIYANTHNPKNNTRYYRWDFAETWKFHSKYYSGYVTNGTAIVQRRADQMFYYCFGSDISSNIILGSSEKLQQDVIYQNPITTILSTSEKIEMKYSILLKQYGLTKDAYLYWQNLQKNTEQLGSIFDAQPSTSSGNIHNTADPTEPVIGFISATNVKSKRVFISNDALPPSWQPAYPYNCGMDSIKVKDVAALLIPIGSTFIPMNPFSYPKSTMIDGYISSSIECTDCTIRGTVKQPVFWK
ncbi:DUF4249 domain-containing protein [uncultured Mucilaginibacter sp.]|uniref:DUF4249 domain-containing protein n=1 Tax=uncultured Mucilaginibacter sp. TaxID=797541 RepID=UPI0026066B22|nr:DUF4249 domain-containing protein [uncultured Mucilaginibacter sp.]